MAILRDYIRNFPLDYCFIKGVPYPCDLFQFVGGKEQFKAFSEIIVNLHKTLTQKNDIPEERSRLDAHAPAVDSSTSTVLPYVYSRPEPIAQVETSFLDTKVSEVETAKNTELDQFIPNTPK